MLGEPQHLTPASALGQASAPALTRPISLLVVDDHALVLDAVTHLLGAETGVTVNTAASIEAALGWISDHGPYTVVIMEYAMSGPDGLDAFGQVLAANGGRGVALMSGSVIWPVIERALQCGAAGFVPKALGLRSFVNAVRFLATGETYLPADILRQAQGGYGRPDALKPIEQSVLMYICDGLQNKEIASALDITEVTVKMHVKSVCTKLGAKNRTHAAMLAKRENMC